MKRRVVLIVSKEATIRAALARIMRRAGYAVELAEGAKRAREVTGNGLFHVEALAENQWRRTTYRFALLGTVRSFSPTGITCGV